MSMTKYSKEAWGTEEQTQGLMGANRKEKLRGARPCCSTLCSLPWDLCSSQSEKEEALGINNRVKFQVERVHKAMKGRDKKSPQETHYGGI